MNEIFTLPLLSLIISAALITGLLVYVLKIKNKTSLQNIFCLDLLCVFIICVGVILQAILSKLCNIPAILKIIFILVHVFCQYVFYLLEKSLATQITN